jgi:hypothetical protein
VLGLRHPFSRALYERDEDLVRVTTVAGVAGWFAADGRWVRGELREADPQLCGWVAGPQVAGSRVQSAPPS